MRWETTGTTFAQTFKQIFVDYFIHVGTIHVHNVQIRWRAIKRFLFVTHHLFPDIFEAWPTLWFCCSTFTETTISILKNTVFHNENDWIGLIILIPFENKKKLPDRKISWFCFMAFLKNVWLFWSKIVRIVMFLFWFEEFYEWLKAKQKLFGEPDRKKWICTFRGEARAKSKCFSTSRELKEETVISKKKKSYNTSSNNHP